MHIGSDSRLFQAASKLNGDWMTLLNRCSSLARTLILNCRASSGSLSPEEFLLDIRCLPERIATDKFFGLLLPSGRVHRCCCFR